MAFLKQINSDVSPAFRQHPIFEGWALAELKTLYEVCEVIKLQPSDYLFQRDQPCYAFYLIEEGGVQMQWQTKTGVTKTLHQRGKGETVGDACILMGDKYRVDALVTEPTLLLRISKQYFYAQLGKHPHLMAQLISKLSQNLCFLFGDVLSAASVSGTQRVINYLLAKAPLRNHVVVELNTSKAQVAALLNLTPEHFSRILHDLTKQGFIEVTGRQVAIENVDGLLMYAR